MAAAIKQLRVLELYSGIGGMHFALKESELNYEVVMAMDVNVNANAVYSHNFPETKVDSSSIEALSVKRFSQLQIDMVLMSPPCQPFTRVGKQQDTGDVRTKSFLHVLDLLSKVEHPPTYILVENVKGFDCSESRDVLIETLKCRDYHYQIENTVSDAAQPWLVYKNEALKKASVPGNECPCSAVSCSVTSVNDHDCDKPNKRLKTELHCGSGKPDSRCPIRTLPVSPKSENMEDNVINILINSSRCIEFSHGSECFPQDETFHKSQSGVVKCTEEHITYDCLQNYGHNMRQSNCNDPVDHKPCLRLSHFLEDDSNHFSSWTEYRLREKDFKRFVIMDVVNPCSVKTCCFTKRYGHYIEGAGSLIQMSSSIKSTKEASQLKATCIEQQNRTDWGDNELQTIRNLDLRYFTPREIANLLCFPKDFCFPSNLTTRQKYMLLGNSLNVHIVSVLLRFLVQ
ncbi:tRNA (cytosine(38)-C(5))-methyltransferase-like isoform X2 [Dreissena polymorpha]|uniref:tRNA (cytosine(38)-C(5))-methyltransferase-like isoform X2 n=1 Tax=Dreissena polymorpha TaxID=45954 RepID=UPI0022649F17|nr:tRNA (cytosine(38)-C(5))-methyltransferase-like isoform X2 [Dreissena polymorpha]